MTDTDKVAAPFTVEQVENLNLFQKSGIFHPFTCGNADCRSDLIATEEGWVCPNCDYTQDWAHPFMASGVEKMVRDSPFIETKKPCRNCRGSGINRKSNYRYTSGGQDDRSCPDCNGTGMRDG